MSFRRITGSALLVALTLLVTQVATGRSPTPGVDLGDCALPWPPGAGLHDGPGHWPWDDGCPTEEGDCNASMDIYTSSSTGGSGGAGTLEWGALPPTPTYGSQTMTDGNCALEFPCTFDIGIGVDIEPVNGGDSSDDFNDDWHGEDWDGRTNTGWPKWETTGGTTVVTGGDGSSINYYRIQATVGCGEESIEIIQATGPGGASVNLTAVLTCDDCGDDDACTCPLTEAVLYEW